MAANAYTGDRVISWAVIIVWIAWFTFGAVTMGEPEWLAGASHHGRSIEAENARDIGDDCMRQGRFAEAAEAYRLGLEIDPDVSGVTIQLGIALLQLNRIQDAIGVLESAIDKEPGFAHVLFYNLGEAYEKAGDRERAIEYVRRSAETSPFAFRPYIKLAQLHIQQQAWADVIDAFRAALDHRLRREVAYRGTIREALLQKPEDEDFCAKLTALLPQGDPEIELARYDEVIFDRMLAGNHEIAQIHNFIGQAHMMLGEREEAISAFRASLEIWPEFSTAKRNLETAVAEEP